MIKNTFTAFTLFAAGIVSLSMHAQDTPKKFGNIKLETLPCATPEYEAKLLKNHAGRETKAQFEQWIAEKIKTRKALKSANTTNQVVTIPIVVHVIHNGGPVGEAENISNEQILSQITVLNQDYRRQENTPGHNTNPAGADIEVEFCMAQRDPFGLASNGIDRIAMYNDSPLGWDFDDVAAIKAQTQWDPEKYLNIWTFNMVTLQGAYELYGFSQFPIGSGLEGLTADGMPTTAETDGIIIAAKCFGSEALYPGGYYMDGRNQGRTVSHEVGHFLGLRHIWGDENNCTADDYCADTPITFTANQGDCPAEGFDSCPESPGTDMFENYMDYTNDVCMNVFTQDQKSRIMAVLENSPRRNTLITSNSCTPGAVYANDATLNILNMGIDCGTTYAPQIGLLNSGTTTITSAAIGYHTDNGTVETFNWSGSLASGEEASVQLPVLTATSGSHTFSFTLLSVNGMPDEAAANDTKTRAFTISGYTTNQVIVTVKTDSKASQTFWAVGDLNEDEPLYSIEAGDYSNNQVYTTTVNIPESGCYSFIIYDMGGNGICCANGNGYYTVTLPDGTLIAEGGEFTVYEIKNFGIDATLGTNSPATMLNAIKLFPNPANSSITIAIPDAKALPDGYTIYNSLGQVVDNGAVTSASQAINVEKYANGAYFIKLQGNGTAQTLQFIKY